MPSINVSSSGGLIKKKMDRCIDIHVCHWRKKKEENKPKKPRTSDLVYCIISASFLNISNKVQIQPELFT